jgi:hypothetical protein
MTESAREAARRLTRSYIDQGYKPINLHTYRDASGTELYHRMRLKHPNGEKIIRPMYLNGNGYTLGEPKFKAGKPLYALDEIARRAGEPVYIVEGENCADALNQLGVLATTSGGATSAGTADWQPLAGRTCVLWPDNDDSGRDYMVAVAEHVERIGCTYTAIDVANVGLAPKGDVVDWLQTAGDEPLEALRALPRLAPIPKGERSPQLELNGPEWPDPQPLPGELPVVQPFDLDLLPEAFHGWIGDVSDRMQCPPDFPAVAAMVALGSVLGRRMSILPKRADIG